MKNHRKNFDIVGGRRLAGFTLIELLVVISIIGVLATLIVPSVSLAKALGRRTKCAAHLHDVGVALQMYLSESNYIMPYAAAMPSLNISSDPRIVDVLEKYSSGKEMWQCPSDTIKCYYASEGASYQYHSTMGGRQVDKMFMSGHLTSDVVPVFFDYEPFHGQAGVKGSANYLFADMHVGDLVN